MCEEIKKELTPEEVMKMAFEYLSKTRSALTEARLIYLTRNNEGKADQENAANITLSLQHIGEAYDEISAIWENDINV